MSGIKDYKYTVVTGRLLEGAEFFATVERHVAVGWRCVGGVCVRSSPRDGTTLFAQAMEHDTRQCRTDEGAL